MKTLGLAVLLLACVALGLAVASNAVGATITYFGTDTVTQADWRSTSVAKPNDLSGDYAYGTDGWMRAQKSGGNWPNPPGVLANPTYATLAFDPHVVQTEGEASVYMDIDQPLAPAATVVDCKAVVGYLWNHPDGDMATITMTGTKSFRLTILTNARTDAANYGNTGYGIKGPGGLDVLHSYAKATQRNWTQFDIAGVSGDVFTIYSTTIGSEHDLSVIALDSMPTPVASALSGNWHNSGTWTPVGVPTTSSAVTVDTHAVAIDTTIVSTPADCYSLTLSNSGSVSVTGQTLNVAGQDVGVGALNTTGGSLALDATSTLNIAKANTSASFAGLTVASGTILNVTSELTVDSAKDLSGATINTPKLTLAGGTLTKSDGLTIGSGKLISGNGTVVGTVTVASGGKVSPGASVGTLTVAGLTLSSGSLLDFEFNSITPANDQITVTGSDALTINGGAISLYNEGGTTTFSTAGTYNLIGYSGSGTPASSNLSVQNKVAGKKYTFGTASSFVTLSIAQGASWNGNSAINADWSDSANWSGGSPSTGDVLPFVQALQSGTVLNNNIASGSFASLQFESGAPAFTLNGNSVTLTGDPSSNVVLNNSASIQTVNLPITLTGAASLNAASGAIVIDSGSTIANGGFDLTIKGANAVTLNGAISGGGGVIRSTDAGALNINSATALGTGRFTINGGTIDNTSGGAVAVSTAPPQTWAGNFTFTGTQDLNLGTGPVTMSAARNVTVNGTKTLTIGGAITGTGFLLQKYGTGTMVISSAGNDLGALTVRGGELRIDNSVAGSPTLTTPGQVIVRDSALLRVNNATVTTSANRLEIGNQQTGCVIMEGASIWNLTGGDLRMGQNQGRAALYLKNSATINGTGRNLNGGAANVSTVYIGLQDTAQATFSTVYVANDHLYDDGRRGMGTVLELKDTAQLTATGDMYVARYLQDSGRTGQAYNTGQVYQHGGTVTVGGSLRMADQDTTRGANTTYHELKGNYNLSGGTLNVGGRVLGSFTAAIANAGNVDQAYFNFHGGTLAYTGAGDQSDFINLSVNGTQSVSNLRIWEGATINTGAKNLTVAQNLLGPTGQGISAIGTAGLTTQVYDDLIPPWVYINGGGGNGATAVATLDATGHVNAIIVTNPGNDYTSTPTIELIRTYDAHQPVPAGNITLAANSSYTGGLTKQGTGILTLTGANTYTGNTTVTEGTLSVSTAFFDDASSVFISFGAVLNLNTSATDTISYLYLASIMQNPGTYSLALGNASGYLTGSGELYVLTPEPATLALMALGGLGLILGRKRK